MKQAYATWAGLFFCLFAAQISSVYAQTDLNYPEKENIHYTPKDSSMHLNFSVRMQNRIDINSRNASAYELTNAQFNIRRFRLKSSGFMINPRLSYKIEIALSQDDIEGHPDNIGNVLLDASIRYAITPNLKLRFGQFKLPGNRQRVISSQDLQMVDRSVVNSTYNLDRDIGLLLDYEINMGSIPFQYSLALTNGEGRNIISSSQPMNRQELNLAVTQRVELLPFGAFEDGGDYFEGDLLREETPKLSVGAGFYYNNDAIRTQGQLGEYLYAPRDLSSIFTDFIFKYQGLSLMGEYMQMDSPEPVTMQEGNYRVVQNGFGYMLQGGYAWPSLWEISARYAKTEPGEPVREFQQPETEMIIGFSKYIRGHRIKLQSDAGYLIDESLNVGPQGYWQWRIQMELGF